MNIKSIFRLSLILALAMVPMTGLAQEAEESTAGAVGEPGPWIFTFMGVPFAVPGSEAAEGSVDSNSELGVCNASTDDAAGVGAKYYYTNSGPTANG